MRRPLVLLVLGALAAPACGQSDSDTATKSVAAARANTRVLVENDAIDGAPTSGPVVLQEAQPGGGAVRGAEQCSIASRTLATAVEAYYAQNGRDITTAQDLVTDGMLNDIDSSFVIDFDAEVPTPVPVDGGPCDYDFEAAHTEIEAEEESAWWDRHCWLDQIAVEITVAGFTAATGRPPTSLAEIGTVYSDFRPESWPTVEVGENGRVIDLVEGGCDLESNVEVFGEEWAAADPQCAVDAWTLAYALHFSNGFGEPGITIVSLADARLIDAREYRYEVVDGGLTNVDGSGCPVMNPNGSSGSDDASSDAARACEVTQRVIETASEAFVAQYGRSPDSIDELVEVDYLRDTPDGWTLVEDAADGSVSVSPTPGSTCDVVPLD